MLAVLLLGAITLGLFIRREIAIDRCLDAGGRWNSASHECEFSP
jgi:hypothetical protein